MNTKRVFENALIFNVIPTDNDVIHYLTCNSNSEGTLTNIPARICSCHNNHIRSNCEKCSRCTVVRQSNKSSAIIRSSGWRVVHNCTSLACSLLIRWTGYQWRNCICNWSSYENIQNDVEWQPRKMSRFNLNFILFQIFLRRWARLMNHWKCFLNFRHIYVYRISEPPRWYWNSRLFFTLENLEFQLFHQERVLEFQTFYMTTPGIPDFYSWPPEISSFCWNSRLFLNSWVPRGCWNSTLLFQDFLSTALGLPDIFVKPVWNSIFFVGKNLPFFRGVGYYLE